MTRRLRAAASGALVAGVAASGLVLAAGPAQAEDVVTGPRPAPLSQHPGDDDRRLAAAEQPDIGASDDQRIPRAAALSLILVASSMHLRRWLRDTDPDRPPD